MKVTFGQNEKSVASMTIMCSNTSHAKSSHRPNKSANSVRGVEASWRVRWGRGGGGVCSIPLLL